MSRKTESSDMHDLVHMMTQTLRMDVGDAGRELGKGRLDSTAMPEFKLNRKYRDTLVLHGKARDEAGNLSLGEIPTGEILRFNPGFIKQASCSATVLSLTALFL